MMEGMLSLGRDTKKDIKHSHKVYTRLWPVFQRASDAAADAGSSDEDECDDEDTEIVVVNKPKSSKKQPKEAEEVTPSCLVFTLLARMRLSVAF